MKKNKKRLLKIVFWFVFCTSVISLMNITQEKVLATPIDAPRIQIFVDDENSFLTQEELKVRLEQRNLIFAGQQIKELNTEKIEAVIENMEEVREVAVYRNLNGTWNVEARLCQPIARLFTRQNNSYFIDSEGNIINSNPQHLARVLIVTGDVPDQHEIQRDVNPAKQKDRISIERLATIYRLSAYICMDELFRAMIGQVHLTDAGDFILTPIIGEQRILFGTARTDREVAEKFDKLRVFYQEAVPYEGWNKYSEISLKYDGQIVCKKRNE